METMRVDGLTLYYDAVERASAELMRQACEKSVQLVQESWGIDVPQECRVYLMTSWLKFIFHAPPWPQKIWVGLTLPLWFSRVRRLWAYAGGWAQQFGKRVVMGAKPPRLIRLEKSSIGDRIFVKQEDVNAKFQEIVCHELVHAFTEHLRLPGWLNEGLSMVAVDRYFEAPTVRADTLDILARSSGGTGPGTYREAQASGEEAVVYLYARGYWITRYLEDVQPGLLKDLLTRRETHEALEEKVAAALGMTREAFWRDIDGLLVAHFSV